MSDTRRWPSTEVRTARSLGRWYRGTKGCVHGRGDADQGASTTIQGLGLKNMSGQERLLFVCAKGINHSRKEFEIPFDFPKATLTHRSFVRDGYLSHCYDEKSIIVQAVELVAFV